MFIFSRSFTFKDGFMRSYSPISEPTFDYALFRIGGFIILELLLTFGRSDKPSIFDPFNGSSPRPTNPVAPLL